MIMYPFRYNFLFSLELIYLPLRVVVLSIYLFQQKLNLCPHYTVYSLPSCDVGGSQGPLHCWSPQTLRTLTSGIPLIILLCLHSLTPWWTLSKASQDRVHEGGLSELFLLYAYIWLIVWGSRVGILGWKSFCPRDFEDIASFQSCCWDVLPI